MKLICACLVHIYFQVTLLCISNSIVVVTWHVFVSYRSPWGNQETNTCCLWSHGLRPTNLQSSVGAPPTPFRDLDQRPLASSVTSVAYDKSDNEIVPRTVHRYPGIFLTVEETPGRTQQGDGLMEDLCDQSSLQMGSLTSKCGQQDRTTRQEGKRRKGVEK